LPKLPEIRPEPRSRIRPGAVVFAFLAALQLAAAAGAETLRVNLDGGLVATLEESGEIYLEAVPERGEGLYSFTRRFTGDSAGHEIVSEINGRPRRLVSGVRYKVPYRLLLDAYKLSAVRALFPSDRPLPSGWEHRVASHTNDPSLWRIAEWFTGDGRNFAALRQANDLADDTVRPGQTLRIPAHLLLEPFRQELSLLEYERDGDEQYAVYRLKSGEALYSSVVVRFTGATFAEDVKNLSREIAELNAIPDVTDIPVNRPIRIPFDLLLPEYLPADDPRRVEYDKDRTESDKYSNPVIASRLEGITVIVDAGHGGQDPGSSPAGVWESAYVYDVMLRVKKLLETTTAARVVPTTRDGSGFDIADRDVLPLSRRHAVLTTPPYPIEDARVSTNLRWYLANSRHREAVRTSGDAAKTVFVSIHADSLHPSHRGVMIYVPATSLTEGEFGKVGGEYSSRKEVKEKPRVSFTWKERTRSEGLSRELANDLLQSFRQHEVAIHREKPIRDRVIRCRRCRPWVPAVVRYNAVPAKLLLEICNLNNDQDRRLLQTRAFRQKVAAAIVDGILEYYGQETLPAPPTVAAR
jgi:N-acetylmuramoyl-L-alanine amidase